MASVHMREQDDLGMSTVNDQIFLGDQTLLTAIIDMAERGTLTVGSRDSDILRPLAPIQWLVQRAFGRGLKLEQAIAVDALLNRYFGDEQAPSDALLRSTISILQATNRKVAKLIEDWHSVEDAPAGRSDAVPASDNRQITSAAA